MQIFLYLLNARRFVFFLFQRPVNVHKAEQSYQWIEGTLVVHCRCNPIIFKSKQVFEMILLGNFSSKLLMVATGSKICEVTTDMKRYCSINCDSMEDLLKQGARRKLKVLNLLLILT
jgi:hypothetical protein